MSEWTDDALFNEVAALAAVVVLAVPAVILMLCVLEESPLKTHKTFEDIPFICGIFSASDIVGFSNASLVCFILIAATIMVSAGLSGLFFMGWRGAVATDNVGSFGFSALQLRVHPQAPSFSDRATRAVQRRLTKDQASLISFGHAMPSKDVSFGGRPFLAGSRRSPPARSHRIGASNVRAAR
mmetsp:Transcript_57421/g.136487  ORF Transcript_57421/g.136487 Transcript_57421/m.136487 type:complete len:183 (-) Transcript_57421:55-603(-)